MDMVTRRHGDTEKENMLSLRVAASLCLAFLSASPLLRVPASFLRGRS